jgi:outer membrane protein TolC
VRPVPNLARTIALVVLAAGAGAAGASAQTVTANPDSAFAAALAHIRGEDLTLEDAIAAALVHATGIRESEAGVRAAEGALRRERGGFDPVLFADLEIRDDDTPSSTPFTGAAVLETQERTAAAGARLRLPIGTEFEAVLETSRLETNSAFAGLNPEYSTQGRLQVRQPLLRGFGPAASGDRSSAERSLDAARARYTEATLAVQAEVTTTYWDLYASERDLAVQRLIAERAEAFLDEASRRADVGLVGPSEVATARVFLSEQQLNELDGEERLDEVSDRLVSLLGRGPDDESRFHPTSEPPADMTVESVDALIGRALAWHGELRAARRDVEASRAEADGARWNAFPTLDVVGSIGGNGLDGKGRAVDFGDTTIVIDADGGLGESVKQAVTGDFPLWSVGVTLEVPIGFREGRGERDRLNAEVERAEQQAIEIERTLQEDVRARHRELRHGLRRLELAREGVDASLDQVRIGTIEYENGRTTAFELVRLGADLATAQERYSDALVRTAKAAAELRRLAPSDDVIRSLESER